jgi:hypothetical protein
MVDKSLRSSKLNLACIIHYSHVAYGTGAHANGASAKDAGSCNASNAICRNLAFKST